MIYMPDDVALIKEGDPIPEGYEPSSITIRMPSQKEVDEYKSNKPNNEWPYVKDETTGKIKVLVKEDIFIVDLYKTKIKKRVYRVNDFYLNSRTKHLTRPDSADHVKLLSEKYGISKQPVLIIWSQGEDYTNSLFAKMREDNIIINTKKIDACIFLHPRIAALIEAIIEKYKEKNNEDN
jgi:hypothetical protein